MNQRLSCLNLTDWFGGATGKRIILSGDRENETFCRALYCLVTKDFTVWPLCLLSAVWSCLIVLEYIWRPVKHSIKQLRHFLCFRVLWVMFCAFGQHIKYVWRAHASRLAPWLVSIVCSSAACIHLCFNRLATYFNISVVGDQTMFHDVWSRYISRL